MKYRIERAGTPGHYQRGWFVQCPNGTAAWLPTWAHALSAALALIESGVGR